MSESVNPSQPEHKSRRGRIAAIAGTVLAGAGVAVAVFSGQHGDSSPKIDQAPQPDKAPKQQVYQLNDEELKKAECGYWEASMFDASIVPGESGKVTIEIQANLAADPKSSTARIAKMLPPKAFVTEQVAGGGTSNPEVVDMTMTENQPGAEGVSKAQLTLDAQNLETAGLKEVKFYAVAQTTDGLECGVAIGETIVESERYAGGAPLLAPVQVQPDDPYLFTEFR